MFLEKFKPQSYALLRIMAGFLLLWHGAQKLFEYPVASSHEMPVYIVYVAGPIELVGGVLVMIGLFTRYAAFLCAGFFAVAYWMAHGTKAFLPLLNGGELAVLYCFVFLCIATHGAGIWSIDKK